MIELRTLGTLGLRDRDGVEIGSVLAQPKRLALLAYLAIAAPGGFVRRDTLLAMFWPESSDVRARGAFRQALLYLRRSLGDGVVVNRAEDELGIASGALHCDAAEFMAALGQGDLAGAVSLYRGDLLQGLFVADAPEFERWLAVERGELRRRAGAAAWSLADTAGAAGDNASALDWARQAVELAPVDEVGIRRWITLLDERGDRAGAVMAYKEFTRRLAEELELEPSPETRALIDDIRRRTGRPLPEGPGFPSTPSSQDVVATMQVRLEPVLALWGVATAGMGLTAWAATTVIGLPDWVLPGGLLVMMAGLPVILATAYVQRLVARIHTVTPELGTGATAPAHGRMAMLALKAIPHLSWRRTWLGGAVAVGAFTLLVAGFMVLRAQGIGPMGSLQGRGVLGSREALVVADFRGPAADAELGPILAEALRTDLGQSAAFNVLTRGTLRAVLGRMNRPGEPVVHFDLAREIAIREGVKAVLDGEVVRLGQGYVISARLVSALDGSELATFRREAANEDALLRALGRLSRDVRERAGESLRSIRTSPELRRVTTHSLAALRKFTESSRVDVEEGNPDRALALLGEAVELDTAFAMAWRRIAVLLRNEGRERARQLEAAEMAYRHRARATELERLMIEGSYFTYRPDADVDRALAAYEQMLLIDPQHATALNNSALLLVGMRELERAEARFRQVTNLPRPNGVGFLNLLHQQVRLGRPPEALDSTVAAFRARFPMSAELGLAEAIAAWGRRDPDQVDSISRAAYAAARATTHQVRSAWWVSSIAELRGQPREGLRWQTLATQATARARPGPASNLSFTLDSMYYATYFDQDSAAARRFLARGLARAPLEEIPPSERPWRTLAEYAAALGDSGLARQALEGFERDQATLGADPVGDRAYYRAVLALTTQQWGAAISHLHDANVRAENTPDYLHILLGRAHDMAERPDSAIRYFELVLATPRALPYLHGRWLPRLHKRLGELYEAKGDTDRAISHYDRFVNLWRNAEPELQPQVREVRQRLERLRPRRE